MDPFNAVFARKAFCFISQRLCVRCGLRLRCASFLERCWRYVSYPWFLWVPGLELEGLLGRSLYGFGECCV